jgi:hypothetical protein
MNTQDLPDAFTHHTTIVNGIKLHYVIGGDGEPVFFYTATLKLPMLGAKLCLNWQIITQ